MTDTPDQPAEIPGVQPALTAKQWRRRATGDDTGDVFVSDAGRVELVLEPHVCVGILNRHGAAALCLYGTPEGFTQEEVDALLDIASDLDWMVKDKYLRRAALLRSVTAKIAALLPPKSLP